MPEVVTVSPTYFWDTTKFGNGRDPESSHPFSTATDVGGGMASSVSGCWLKHPIWKNVNILMFCKPLASVSTWAAFMNALPLATCLKVTEHPVYNWSHFLVLS